MVDLGLPGGEVNSFTLEIDWYSRSQGYLLFVEVIGRKDKVLIDLGSHKSEDPMYSLLGELDALQWALKATKSTRGWRPTKINIDSKGVVDRWSANTLKFDDVRVAWRCQWIMANDLGIQLIYKPRNSNKGADLLNRPLDIEQKKVHIFFMEDLDDALSIEELN